MAQQFVIDGGKTLEGTVAIQGSKNTILPLIAAAFLTSEPVHFENVPEISDVATMTAIAENLGAAIDWDKSRQRLSIRADTLTVHAPDETLSRKLRGSVLFAGALLGRMRTTAIPYPGGDAIGARPLTTHFRALEALGAVIREENGHIRIDGGNMRGNAVTLDEPSVTATENTILAAVLTPGRTIIRLPACEPHVQELVLFLRKMGADIRWRDVLRLDITGVASLSGAAHRVNPDELEISSFAALAAATRSSLALRGITPEYLDAVLLQLKKMRVAYTIDGDMLCIRKPTSHYTSFRLQSGLYPKLGSDHLPPFAVLATQSEGTTLIHDWLYEGRLRYIAELQKMGADCTLLDPHRALVTGPTALAGAAIESLDIRSGMTLIIAALVANGRSTISHVDHIDRGYARIDERLRAVGAAIRRIPL